MKKIIGGKRYDTDTAKEVGSDSYSNPRDFSYWEETLYRKNTGEFFLYGEGGANSRYAVQIEQNTWSGGQRINPLSFEEAKSWAEEHLDGNKYESIFGTVEETSEKRTCSFSLTETTIEKIKRGAAEADLSMSEYIDRVIANASQ